MGAWGGGFFSGGIFVIGLGGGGCGAAGRAIRLGTESRCVGNGQTSDFVARKISMQDPLHEERDRRRRVQVRAQASDDYVPGISA